MESSVYLLLFMDLDARLGFQQDGAPRWRESVVLAGGGDDHGMDVVVRLTVDVPNNVVC